MKSDLSTVIPFGKHSADSVMWFGHISVMRTNSASNRMSIVVLHKILYYFWYQYLSANIWQTFSRFSHGKSAKVQLGLKFGKKIKTNWPTYFVACYTVRNSALFSVSEPFDHVNQQKFDLFCRLLHYALFRYQNLFGHVNRQNFG